MCPQYRRAGGGGMKLTQGPEEIRGHGINQGALLVGKYYFEFRYFITRIKNYCLRAISGCQRNKTINISTFRFGNFRVPNTKR